MQVMYPAIFKQLLQFVEFSCKPPQYGKLEAKHAANAKYNQVSYELFTVCPVSKPINLCLYPIPDFLHSNSFSF